MRPAAALLILALEDAQQETYRKMSRHAPADRPNTCRPRSPGGKSRAPDATVSSSGKLPCELQSCKSLPESGTTFQTQMVCSI
jgi:hypothetical protein